jgi:hypothetical protein
MVAHRTGDTAFGRQMSAASWWAGTNDMGTCCPDRLSSGRFVQANVVTWVKFPVQSRKNENIRPRVASTTHEGHGDDYFKKVTKEHCDDRETYTLCSWNSEEQVAQKEQLKKTFRNAAVFDKRKLLRRMTTTMMMMMMMMNEDANRNCLQCAVNFRTGTW